MSDSNAGIRNFCLILDVLAGKHSFDIRPNGFERFLPHNLRNRPPNNLFDRLAQKFGASSVNKGISKVPAALRDDDGRVVSDVMKLPFFLRQGLEQYGKLVPAAPQFGLVRTTASWTAASSWWYFSVVRSVKSNPI